MSLEFIALPVHLLALATAAVGIFLADRMGFAWIRGTVETLPERRVLFAHRLVAGALFFLIASGLILFWPMRAYLLHDGLFWVKMFFVAGLVVNALFISELMHHAHQRPFHTLPTKDKIPLFVSGMVSTVCWIGAALCGLFLF